MEPAVSVTMYLLWFSRLNGMETLRGLGGTVNCATWMSTAGRVWAQD